MSGPNKLMAAWLSGAGASGMEPPAPLPAGYQLRPVTAVAEQPLAAAFVQAYGPAAFPGGVEEALAEVRGAFAGEYGELIAAASVAATRQGQLAAVVLTVRRAPWPDTPPGPFVLDLITTPAHRRQGLARHLLRYAVAHAQPPAESVIGLRVEVANTAAQQLYRDTGFHDWTAQSSG